MDAKTISARQVDQSRPVGTRKKELIPLLKKPNYAIQM